MMNLDQIDFEKVSANQGLSAASIEYNRDDQLVREYDGVPVYQTLQPVYDVVEPKQTEPTLTREPLPDLQVDPITQPTQPDDRDPLPILEIEPIAQPTQPDVREPIPTEPISPETGGIKPTEPIQPVVVEPTKPVKEPIKETEPIGTTSVEPEKPTTTKYKVGGMQHNSLWWIGGIALASYIGYKIYDKPKKKKNN